MAQVRLSMRKIEEILRLKYEAGLTHREIARSCVVSASTVSEYITHARAAGLSWPLPECCFVVMGIAGIANAYDRNRQGTISLIVPCLYARNRI
jgi:hypothetical protein